jgi:chromosome segregation ATPase
MNVDTGTEMLHLTPEMKVKVKEVSIRGFKSVKYKSKIGPLSEFSCIVGPNGAGKSVCKVGIYFN